jgi:hypothetical protein
MKNNRFAITALILTMTLLATACGTLQLEVESAGDIATPQDSSNQVMIPEPPADIVQPTVPTSEPQAQRVVFEQLGISLEIPPELYVKKEPLVKYEDQSKLQGYLFHIQNYGYPGGPSSGSFQMYGHLQYNLQPITWERFIEIQDDSQGMYEYITPIEINGLKGYDAQFAGQRNRYVYTFYLQGQVLTIAVADPTPENKARSDEIIATLQYDPAGFTNDSQMMLVNDPAQLYQVLLPEDWDYSFQSTIGTQLSSLEASSPDLEVIVDDEVEGPHGNVYYKQGISLHIQVIDDDSLQFNPGWPDQRQYGVYFNGILGSVYVFREPSTAEGELQSVSVTHEGRSYLLRFGYAEDADLYTIDRIISNFIITPEEFYPTP